MYTTNHRIDENILKYSVKLVYNISNCYLIKPLFNFFCIPNIQRLDEIIITWAKSLDFISTVITYFYKTNFSII